MMLDGQEGQEDLEELDDTEEKIYDQIHIL